jgi:D-alanyl-lipoteichoic acid acyltransferase DltB (MBOAT superfamily)
VLFNSLEFLIFLPAVVALYFATPHRFRWILLLAASYYFYAAWKAEYLVLIIASTAVDYWAGLQMGKRESRRARRPFLFASLASNLGLLFFFKYANFFGSSAETLLRRFDILTDIPAFHFLLPVGISFYTFQTLSYSIDVYNGAVEPERHLGRFALYVSFFPQLVAGPIERSSRLLPQFLRDQVSGHRYSFDRMRSGLTQILWGLFKKVVIADRLAIYVNEVYNNPGSYEGAAVVLATYFFAFQIYCDFSGYSDIAIGSARLMGYDLMDNFNRPYFSKSIGEFWRRWHISLSTWFRDYLYIPLGGNRVVKWRWYYNLVVVFVVSGLWHGANWTFVIWGALHGVYLVAGVVTADRRNAFWERIHKFKPSWKTQRIRELVAVFLVFHLTLVAWVFFRANSVADVGILFSHMAQFDWEFLWRPRTLVAEVPGFSAFQLGLAVLSIGVLLLVHLAERRLPLHKLLPSQPLLLRWILWYVLIFATIGLGVFGAQEFIYFQF